MIMKRLLPNTLALILALWAGLPARAEEWDTVPAADLAATDCALQPGASAEILIDDNRVDFSTHSEESTLHYHKRIKFYTEESLQDLGIVAIEMEEELLDHSELRARVTHADGTKEDYKTKQFTRTKVVARKAGYGGDIIRLALAPGALRRGDVLDVKWRLALPGMARGRQNYFCQQEVPVRRCYWRLQRSAQQIFIRPFNMPGARVTKTSDGIEMLVENLPAYLAEPLMPPEKDCRGRLMIVMWSMEFSKPGAEVWKDWAAECAEDFDEWTKPDRNVKEKAATLIGGIQDARAKLDRLHDFCSTAIINAELSPKAPEIKSIKRDPIRIRNLSEVLDKSLEGWRPPPVILKSQAGSPRDINLLLASLARAAGFEVRGVRCATRSNTLQITEPITRVYLGALLIQVKVGTEWITCDPGSRFYPAGMVPPRNELAPYMPSEKNGPALERMPASNAELTRIERKARLSLDENGDLRGDIEISYTGHAAAKLRISHAKGVDGEYNKEVTAIHSRFPTARTSSIQWENTEAGTKPLVVKYRVEVPAYAQQAGAKFLVPVSFFEVGIPNPLSAAQRQHPVFFDYTKHVEDDVRIVLPEAYTLENGAAPKSAADPGRTISVAYQLGYKKKAREVMLKRSHVLGATGGVAFPVSNYPTLRRLFEIIHTSDEHVVVCAPESPDAPHS